MDQSQTSQIPIKKGAIGGVCGRCGGTGICKTVEKQKPLAFSKGNTMPVEIEREEKCPGCSGTGYYTGGRTATVDELVSYATEECTVQDDIFELIEQIKQRASLVDPVPSSWTLLEKEEWCEDYEKRNFEEETITISFLLTASGLTAFSKYERMMSANSIGRLRGDRGVVSFESFSDYLREFDFTAHGSYYNRRFHEYTYLVSKAPEYAKGEHGHLYIKRQYEKGYGLYYALKRVFDELETVSIKNAETESSKDGQHSLPYENDNKSIWYRLKQLFSVRKDTSVQPVAGWGPTRPTFTNEQPAKYAVFNSITNNVAVGDERDFVRIVEKGTGETYKNKLVLKPDKQYEIYIYYHNDASGTYNSKEHNYVGVAGEVRVSSCFPDKLNTGEHGGVSAMISSANGNPAKVWAVAEVTATEDITLHYVTGSAKIYNSWGTNGQALPMTLFSKEGTFIGTNDLNGVIPGCAEYSGHILYTIQTRSALQEG